MKDLSFSQIKELASKFDVYEDRNNKEFIDFLNKLNSDKRKNVQGLANKYFKLLNKIEEEIKRVRSMYDFDKSFGSYNYIAGVDEVGRGPLAGPIVACAVILDLNAIDDELILYINDSKKLNKTKREELSEIIKEKSLAYHIAFSDNNEIDNIGIGVANNKVFVEACTLLKIKPDLVLSDGYLVKGLQIDNKSVVKGDTKSASIAAASILAKVYRDNIMEKYSNEFPYYYFEENVGYGTVKHVEAIKKYGPCKIHRMSFLNNILNKD